MYELINQYKEGLITKAEAEKALDKLQIRGAIVSNGSKVKFVGFDYKHQNWIRIN